MNKVTTIILLLIAVAFSGCQKTDIEGKIFDGFGNPVKDAVIKVEGTQFTSQTDGNGKYSVGYVPGDIKVLISKTGFTGTTFSVKISTESTFPAENKIIYEIPKERGIWYMDFASKQYLPIKKCDFSLDKKNSSAGGWTSQELESYFVRWSDIVKAKIELGNNSQSIFLDNTPEALSLIKLDEGVSEAFCEILQRKINNGWMGFQMGDYSDKIMILKEDNTHFDNGIVLRKANIEYGHAYAFVNYSVRNRNPIQGPIYLFLTEDNK